MPDGPPSGDSDVRLPGQDAHHVWEGPDRPALTSGAADGAVGPEEDQEHLRVCPGYGRLWAGLGRGKFQVIIVVYERLFSHFLLNVAVEGGRDCDLLICRSHSKHLLGNQDPKLYII